LESLGVIRIVDPERAYSILKAGSKRQAKEAGDVRACMKRNFEVLIEGSIPAGDFSLVS